MEIIVDLSKVKKNTEKAKRISKSKICAVVKADAYGLGSVAVAHTIYDIVDSFAVATYSEAKELVQAGIRKDIIILGADLSGGEKNIIPTVVSISDYAKKCNTERYNIAINTGMNRLGLTEEEFSTLNWDFSSVFSIFSHIFDDSGFDKQSAIFDKVRNSVPKWCKTHLYSSRYLSKEPKYDMARPGIALYGGIDGYDNAMSVYAEIIKVSTVKKGENIGYGVCLAKRNTKIATLKIGYRDGFSRIKRGEKREVEINGARCSIIGQVCMDMVMVDVSGVECVKEGDLACVLGESMQISEVAKNNFTVPYEILTSFRHREDIRYI